MCQPGDIIVLDIYISDGTIIGTHSFVILSNNKGKIQGLDYNLICNVMSSFKDAEQKKKKLSYPGNFPVNTSDTVVVGNSREGFIKAEQFYYFDESKITYKKIGYMHAEVFDELIEFINNLEVSIIPIIDNLK